MREWVTVAQATVLVSREKRQLYRWIDDGRLAARKNDRGVTEVLAKAVQHIERDIKPGRPRGLASRNRKNR